MRIIVTTCPAYAHILPTFAKAFHRAWPPDFPWTATFVGAFHPDLGWANNLLSYLGDDDEPFLLLLDDFVLDAVDPILLSVAAEHITLPEVGMVRVHPCPGPTLPWPGNPALGEIDKAEPYAISLQASIWRPQVVRDLFAAGEDAWQTETQGSVRARDYTRYKFLGTRRSAVGYRELMRRGQIIAEAQAWVEANLP